MRPHLHSGLGWVDLCSAGGRHVARWRVVVVERWGFGICTIGIGTIGLCGIKSEVVLGNLAEALAFAVGDQPSVVCEQR